MQQPQLKITSTADAEAQSRIRMAIRTMMLLQNSDDSCADTSSNKKRQAPELSETPPSKKRRIEIPTDSVLDEAADEVCLETEWERILADWNPEMENLPFPTDTLVETI